MKPHVHTKSCTRMYIAALFVIVANWKQPTWSLLGGCLRKLWPIHTRRHHSAWKEWTPGTLSNLDGSQGNYGNWKKSQFPKGYITHDSIYKIFLKWKNYKDGEHISGYHELGRLGMWGVCDMQGPSDGALCYLPCGGDTCDKTADK